MGSVHNIMYKSCLLFLILTPLVLSAAELDGPHQSICDSLCQDEEDGLVSAGCCVDFSCFYRAGTGFVLTCKCPDCGFCASEQTCIPLDKCWGWVLSSEKLLGRNFFA